MWDSVCPVDRAPARRAVAAPPKKCLLLRQKQTFTKRAAMSAFDPKRTLMPQNHLSECCVSVSSFATIQCPILTVRDDDEAARVHHASQLRGGNLAARCPRAAA